MHGAKEIEGAEVKLMCVPGILAEEKIKRKGAGNFRKSAYLQLSSFLFASALEELFTRPFALRISAKLHKLLRERFKEGLIQNGYIYIFRS